MNSAPDQLARARVLVVGAYGFIGAGIVAALRERGCEVVCGVRDARRNERFAGLSAVTCDMATDVRVEDWMPRLVGIDVVVNAAGILRESGRDRFETVHEAAPQALFRACEDAGVRRIVQISALGDPMDGEFVASKHRCDAELLRLNLDALVLRPSVVCSPSGSYGGTSLLRALAALPVVMPLPGDGSQRLQPVLLEDLGRIVAAAVLRPAPVRGILEIGGPHAMSVAEYLREWRHWLGFPVAYELRVPAGLARLAATIGERCGSGPLGATIQRMLERGNVAEEGAWMRVRHDLGVQARPLAEALAAHPAQTQDRLQARSYFWLPLLRVMLAALWIGSGLVGLLLPASAIETAISAPPGASIQLLARSTGAIDLLLGALCLSRWRPRWVLGAMLAMLLGYTLAIGVLWPQHWLDPFGGLLKNLPLIAALGLLLATEERR